MISRKKELLPILLMILFTAPQARAAEAPIAGNCFYNHVHEATLLNAERKPLYSRLTDGASERISSRMIFFEKLSLPLARIFDWRASSYQKRGIPVLCDDFVPISHTPKFRAHAPAEPLSKYRKPNVKGWPVEIKKAYRQGGFDAAGDAIERRIAELSDAPTYNCLLRHLMDSILRTARLAPRYVAQSEQKKLRSPARLEWNFIQLQLFFLGQAVKVDSMAAPIQAKGIPIVCQDVPPIPAP